MLRGVTLRYRASAPHPDFAVLCLFEVNIFFQLMHSNYAILDGYPARKTLTHQILEDGVVVIAPFFVTAKFA